MSMANITVYVNRFAAPIGFILGNIGNVLCFLIFLTKPWRKNVCVFYFLICLLMNTIYMYAILLRAIFITGFNINILNSNIILCKLSYYFGYLSTVYLPILFILASIDRLLISSQNLDTRLYSSKRLAYLLISTSFFVISLFSLHALIKVNIEQISPTISICYYEQSKFYRLFILYSSIIFGLLPQVIILVILFLSFQNVRQLRLIPHKNRDRIRSMNKKDFQLLLCLYAHNILYLISILFGIISFIYGIIYPFDQRTAEQQILFNFLFDFSIFIHSIFRCSSFYIFISLSKAFRQELKRFCFFYYSSRRTI